VDKDGPGHRLHVVGDDVLAAVDRRAGLGRVQQGEGGADRRPVFDVRVGPRGLDEVEDVLADAVGDVDLGNRLAGRA